MKTRIVSWPSALTMAACCFVTVYALFSNIFEVGLTVTHLYILLGLVIALASGHAMTESAGPLRIVMIALFVTSSILTCSMAGSQSSAQIQDQEAKAKLDKNSRETLGKRLKKDEETALETQADVGKLKRLWETALADANKTCVDYPGRCSAVQKLRDKAKEDYDARKTELTDQETHIKQLQDRIIALKPVIDNAQLRGLAEILSLITGKDIEDTFALIKKLFPYFLAFMGEGGTIAFSKHAFGRRPQVIEPAPEMPVSIADIAREYGMDPREARKRMREAGIPKPAHGAWSWTAKEAEAIRLKLGPQTRH